MLIVFIMTTLLAQRGDKPCKPVSAEAFAADGEGECARMMAWHPERGGPRARRMAGGTLVAK